MLTTANDATRNAPASRTTANARNRRRRLAQVPWETGTSQIVSNASCSATKTSDAVRSSDPTPSRPRLLAVEDALMVSVSCAAYCSPSPSTTFPNTDASTSCTSASLITNPATARLMANSGTIANNP